MSKRKLEIKTLSRCDVCPNYVPTTIGMGGGYYYCPDCALKDGRHLDEYPDYPGGKPSGPRKFDRAHVLRIKKLNEQLLTEYKWEKP